MPTPSSHLPLTIRIDRARAFRLAPLIFWLIGQLIVLAIGAGRIPLTARAGEMPQHLALPEMIAFQLGICSMTFPWLLAKGNRMAIVVSATLFIHCAAALNSTSTPAECWTGIGVALWLWAMSCRSEESSKPFSQSVGVVLATSLICALPLIDYLIADFGTTSAARLPLWLNPIGSLITQSENALPRFYTFTLSTILITGKIFFAGRQIERVES